MDIIGRTLKIIKDRFKGIKIPAFSGEYILEKFFPLEEGRKIQILINNAPSTRPKFYHAKADFVNRWDHTQETFDKIQASESVEEIKNLLKSLELYLNVEANSPLSFRKGYIDENGRHQMIWMAREVKIDHFFEDSVLIEVRPAIEELVRLENLTHVNGIIQQKQAQSTDQSQQSILKNLPSLLPEFVQIFLSEKRAQEGWEILKSIGVIKENGTYALGERKKSAIAGFVDSCRANGLLRNISDKQIVDSVSRQIGIITFELKRDTDTYGTYHALTEREIKKLSDNLR